MTMNTQPNFRAESLSVELTYDDVLLLPQRSDVDSRSHVDTTMNITPSISVDVPIISSNMDTVTETEMAQAMSDAGACGILHRFSGNSHEEQVEIQEQMVSDVDGLVGATVGVSEQAPEAARRYVEAGANFICLDTPHAHANHVLETLSAVNDAIPDDVDLMAGNVCTGHGAVDLIKHGADSVKVGIGGGSACETRQVTGNGRPQFTAVGGVVEKVNQYLVSNARHPSEVTVIADGGIKTSGDMMKALMVGADAVMVGGFVAGCPESPKDTEYRGMASSAAREDRSGTGEGDGTAAEGADTEVHEKETVADVIGEAQWGLRSACSYCAGHTIPEARENAEFVRVSPQTSQRNGVHGVSEIIEQSQ